MFGIIWSQILGDTAEEIFVDGQTTVDAATISADVSIHAVDAEAHISVDRPAEADVLTTTPVDVVVTVPEYEATIVVEA